MPFRLRLEIRFFEKIGFLFGWTGFATPNKTFENTKKSVHFYNNNGENNATMVFGWTGFATPNETFWLDGVYNTKRNV
jgi:hypothetical protein